MDIKDLLKEEGIVLQAAAQSKKDVISQLTAVMEKKGVLSDRDLYEKDVLAREALGSTGIGEQVAIPHAKSKAVRKPALAAMVVPDGVDFDSLDGQPVKLIFLIAAPDTASDTHLEVLSRLSVLLMDEGFRADLINAKTPQEFLQIIDRRENKKRQNNKERHEEIRGPRILAVTACPTGIAHTYMAAEGLEQKAKEMNLSIKVETNGSGGAKNVLTREEIAQADCIIIAADKKVSMDRFQGKRVITAKVSDGIHRPEALLREALEGGGKIYQSEEGNETAQEERSLGGIYKDLMNGVSHMLPFVIGGGILIALAFLFDNYEINPANFGSNTPVAAFFKSVGDAAFGFMLPVLAGYIAISIADRPGLAVGFVGGYLANVGGSGFLGALLAGFLAGYIVLLLKMLFARLPESLEGIKPVLLYPFFGILLIGLLIQFVVNPPVAALNLWLSQALNNMGATSKVLLGVVLGGMMSIDMGGPINKASYVFGTASIANGQYDIMAAVMIGGMVPPLAVALCTTFFPSRFTRKERQSGLTNYVMGLAFITEGVIPFAASDPLRVIPSCAVGAAVAGGLSMLFGCTLRAPHGGIFVLPVIGNWVGFLGALAIGSLVGMVLLALLKRPLHRVEVS